ncbi:MAG: choice-of-anchor D domain-containing protein [Deltaproteobacteria bacterium]|nr:choice-of-anchor D domain-containing protein [Deltaproteobacteria bacterium]
MRTNGFAALGVHVALLAWASACEPEPLAALPEIDVEPKEIVFGQVAAGRSRAVELTIRNLSPVAILELSALELLGDAETFSFGTPPNTLGPSESVVLAVRHTADDGKGDASELSIRSNASNTPEVRVALRSDSTAPLIELAPRELNLGDTASGNAVVGALTIASVGLAPLEIRRISIRTEGFFGEACSRDSDCREGRCTSSRTGLICAQACQGSCPAGYLCSLGLDGFRACREDEGTSPPRAARGFSIPAFSPTNLLPEEELRLEVSYRPAAADRGSVQLLVDSNDPSRPTAIVPLKGRPENQPPQAIANISSQPNPLEPGGVVTLDGRASFDPEGSRLEHTWRFVHRPPSSRASFDQVRGSTTSFSIDLPGRYTVELSVRDDTGLVSTNEARVQLDAGAGTSFRVELEWDRVDTDLDLHLVRPRAPEGSVGDCFFDNPAPDWGPVGPVGDPRLTWSSEVSESILLSEPEAGVFTVLVRVADPSPQGPTNTRVRFFLGTVEAAVLDVVLSASTESWDVATLNWPSGAFAPLGTLH